MIERYLVLAIFLGIAAILGLIYAALEAFQHWFANQWDSYIRRKIAREERWKKVELKEQVRIKRLKELQEKYGSMET